eukprot:538156_1
MSLRLDCDEFQKLQSAPFSLSFAQPIEFNNNILFPPDPSYTNCNTLHQKPKVYGMPRYKPHIDQWDVFMNEKENFSVATPIIFNKATNKLYIFGEGQKQWIMIDIHSKSITTFKEMDGLGDLNDYANTCVYTFTFEFNGTIHLIGKEFNIYDFDRNMISQKFTHWILDEKSSKFQAIHALDANMMKTFNSCKIKIFTARR